MIFHENRLLADDSHIFIMPYFFLQKFGKMSQNLSSAAVLICALRVNTKVLYIITIDTKSINLTGTHSQGSVN